MTTPRTRLSINRKHLDQKLSPLQQDVAGRRPPAGWIKTIRESLGMSTQQLATRLKISRQAVAQIERSEIEGTLTLNTFEKVANALSCDLKVLPVPRHSLAQIVETRAIEVAREIVARSELHMKLEDQENSIESRKLRIEELAAEMSKQSDRTLWDE